MKSPCAGICRLEKGICVGCLRRSEEITLWSGLRNSEKEKVWHFIENRRREKGFFYLKDQMRRVSKCSYPVERIACLVPSLTQTLYDLGCEEKVVAITSYCPKGSGKKLVLGGTKNPRLGKIENLDVDLFFANKEENRFEDIEAIAAHTPVYVSDINNPGDVIDLLIDLGIVLNAKEKADAISLRIREKLLAVQGKFAGRTCMYFIWRDPWMAAGGSTYIDSLLQHVGYVNLLKHLPRYPEISLDNFKAEEPEVIFLPDEPYTFGEGDRVFIQKVFPLSEVRLLDGKIFSWHGSYLESSLDFFLGCLV